MQFPEHITRLPVADVPLPNSTGYMLRSPDGLLLFFEFTADTDLPVHSHGAQWGTVLEGQITLTIGGETRVYRPGDSYSIGAGVEHGGKISAGTKVIDFFEDADRYQPRE